MTTDFLSPGPEWTDPTRSRTVVLPLPLEKTTSYLKGTAKGPHAIVEASAQVEFFDAQLGSEPVRQGIYTDWELGDPTWNRLPMEEILGRIRRKVGALLEQEKFVLSIGGEHTITVGTIDPYLERWKNDLTIVQIDAHADLRDQYEGSPFSHACVMKRILGRAPIVGAGIRSLDPDEYKIIKEGGYRCFFAHEIRQNKDWIKDLLRSIKTRHVYLTVDVDGFDPSVIPTTGTPEPGGLSWWEGVDLIQAVAADHKIVGADVNEFAEGPIPYAAYAAAKLCYKIIGLALTSG